MLSFQPWAGVSEAQHECLRIPRTSDSLTSENVSVYVIYVILMGCGNKHGFKHTGVALCITGHGRGGMEKCRGIK